MTNTLYNILYLFIVFSIPFHFFEYSICYILCICKLIFEIMIKIHTLFILKTPASITTTTAEMIVLVLRLRVPAGLRLQRSELQVLQDVVRTDKLREQTGICW